MARTAFLITITGRVQRVGFRAFVVRHATELGLDGWVRNRRDGSVEITVIGEPQQVDLLMERCGRGPVLADVEDITLSGGEDDGTRGFHERPTF
jgi:acylphosphatase